MDAETAISIFFGAILAVFSVALVGYAFVRGHQPGPDAGAGLPPESDDPALGDIFDAIRTLELEYQLGRMPQEEFQAQFQAYRVQAATVLRDQLEAGLGDPAWVLEQEILLALDAQEIASGRTMACPDCSAAVPEGTRACPNCGAEMVPQP
ncbi:MAG: zinc ribbon domain-containing protein [Chloroflexi bacterium]|nr:zinc ribbon domain-containing protein [Chloroflexota bacterium]